VVGQETLVGETDTYRGVDTGLREQIIQRSECRCEECGKLMVDRLGGFIWLMTETSSKFL
jgi:ribosomal protein L37AE/L43A